MNKIIMFTLVLASVILSACSVSIIKDEITNFEECVEAGNPVMESYPRQCKANGETFVEEIDVKPEKTFCRPEQRGAEVCTLEYRPVCGWNDETIQCIKYPCASTYSNPCTACAIETVAYWTEGDCPQE